MNMKLLRAEWRVLRRASFRTMHHGLSIVGLAALAGAALVVSRPEYGRALMQRVTTSESAMVATAESKDARPNPFSGAIEHPTAEAGRLLGLAAPDGDASPVVMQPVSSATAPSTSREQVEVGRYLARRYRVNADAVAMLVRAAYTTGQDLKMDPTLLLAVMAIESGFNPFAESTAGASGLMQLMSKVHRDKLDDFGGANIALNPVANLRVGAVVLKDCIRRGGSVADGLRLYVGAGMGDDNGYGARVLQEKDRIAQAIRGSVPRIKPLPAAKTAESAPVANPGADDKTKSDLKASMPTKVEGRSIASL